MDPVGATLGSIALMAPAVQACWSAYGVYTRTDGYGREYRLALRKLRIQREILEGLMRLKLQDLILEDPKDGRPLMEAIVGELTTIRTNFAICSKLIEKLEIKTNSHGRSMKS